MNQKRVDYKTKRIKPLVLAVIAKHSFEDGGMQKAVDTLKGVFTGESSFAIIDDDDSLKFIMSQSPKSQKKSRLCA